MHPSVGLRAVGFPYPPTIPWWRPGDAWVSQVPDVSLPTCHALETPPESPGTRQITRPCCWLPWILTCRPPVEILTRLNRFGEVHFPCGPWDSLSTLRSCRSFVSSFPSRPQDSVRIGGLALAPSGSRLRATFGRDLHPARDAKLRLAHSKNICNRLSY